MLSVARKEIQNISTWKYRDKDLDNTVLSVYNR